MSAIRTLIVRLPGPRFRQVVLSAPGQIHTVRLIRRGQDGRAVEMRKTDTHLQWRLAGDEAWTDLVALSELAGAVAWEGITGKPAEFPPEAHGHAILEITGLDAELSALALGISGKADALHSHAVADVTGLQAELDGKAAATHGHAIADVTGLQTALDGKAASSHSHAIAEVTGLQTALDGKAATSHGHALSDLAQSGATTGQVAKWNGTAWAPANEAGGGGATGKFKFLSGTWDTTVNNALQDVTGISFEMEANKTYRVEVELQYTASASTVGIALGHSGPASPTKLFVAGAIWQTSTTPAEGSATAYGKFCESNSSGGGTGRLAKVEATISNGANAGTWQFQAHVETGVTGTVTIQSLALNYSEVVAP